MLSIFEVRWNYAQLLRTKQVRPGANGTNFSTSLYSPRSSGAIALNIQTASLTDLTERFLRKSSSWICKYAHSISSYPGRYRSAAASQLVSVSSIFSKACYLRRLELPWKRSCNCWTAVSTNKENSGRYSRLIRNCCRNICPTASPVYRLGGLRWRGTCNSSKSRSAATFFCICKQTVRMPHPHEDRLDQIVFHQQRPACQKPSGIK